MKTQAPTQSQTLAFTTAALLNSSLPFMVLSLLCTLVGALALLTPATTVSKILLLVVLLLALPLAWLSLRLLLDAKVMQHWAQPDSEQNYADFDQSLLDLGMIKTLQSRDLITRARGCIGLQKKLLIMTAVQWIIFILALACRML